VGRSGAVKSAMKRESTPAPVAASAALIASR